MGGGGARRTVARMTSRRSRALRAAVSTASAALLLGGLAACGDDGEPTASTSSPSSTPSAAEERGGSSREGTRESDYPAYVALGDSYTSAPFVPETDRGDGCLRSSGNYPSLVAEELGSELVDVSCAGAQTVSLVGAQQTFDGETRPAQFDALDDDTDLVTVGIGGNDLGLFSKLTAGCVAAADEETGGTPCTDAATGTATADLDRISERVTSALIGVQDRAPRARVVLVGYPQLIPAEGSCPALLPLAEGDLPFARTVNRGLADALENAAEAADVEYVDTFALSRGHDICADDPWVNGQVNDPERALAFHPFAAGQEAVADELLRLLEKPVPNA
jgi:lysophospholipase L1-like esterase